MKLFDLAAIAARQLDPELAHTLTIKALKRVIIPACPAQEDEGLAITLPRSGLKLANPVGLAAGFDKNAEVFAPMLRFGFGFVGDAAATTGQSTPASVPADGRPCCHQPNGVQ